MSIGFKFKLFRSMALEKKKHRIKQFYSTANSFLRKNFTFRCMYFHAFSYLILIYLIKSLYFHKFSYPLFSTLTLVIPKWCGYQTTWSCDVDNISLIWALTLINFYLCNIPILSTLTKFFQTNSCGHLHILYVRFFVIVR